jgi:predicted DNA-binding transcriptional regulator AlpA
MNAKSSNQSVAVVDGISARKFSKAKVVAQKLGVCPRTIFRWANDGEIARHKINARVVLFDEAEIISLIEAARV